MFTTHSNQENREYSSLALLLSNTSDEKLVREIFSGDYQINSTKAAFDSAEFDLLITDEQVFMELANDFRKLKQQSKPIVLPVLLLAKNESIRNRAGNILDYVDDILTMPTSPVVLRSRIKLLLQARSYSKQLEQEKRKFQLLAENSTDMISTHSPDGEYVYVSPSSKNVFGYEPEELIGKNAFDYICHQDHDTVMRGRQYTILTGEPAKLEFRKKTKDGQIKWVESIIKTLKFSTETDAVQIQAVTRDISDRKLYEKELKKEISFIDASLDALPNIFFMVDEDLSFVRWNKNLEKEMGYSNSEIRAMSPFDLIKKEDHVRVQQKVQEIFEYGEADLETDLITNAGNPVRYRISGRRFIESNKNFIIGTCVDISKDYEMMRELKASNEEKQVLLLEIHHRVKNNLAIVSSMLQLQAMESDNAELSKKLQDSQMRIQSIASIHELLYQSESFTHLDMGTYIKELIRRIWDTTSPNKNIKLISDLDSIQLNINQAIPCSLIANELITNALKHAFTNKNEGRLRITFKKVNIEKVRLMVEDDGKGLDKHLDLNKPTSLGIELINVLTRQLGAELDISSDTGTKFSLTFQKQEIKGSSSNFL